MGLGVFIPAEILPSAPGLPLPSDTASRLLFLMDALRNVCEFNPFKTPREAVFTQKVHRVVAPVIKNVPLNEIKYHWGGKCLAVLLGPPGKGAS